MARHDPTLDALFQSLADPTRRAILARLARGPATVSDLAAPFDMALPSFMGHLTRLESAGLIHSTKQGRVRTCTLMPEAFQPVRSWLDEQKDMWDQRLDRFDAYVTTLMKDRKDEA
jgi:DNA-binding transcriptional ArsR family regulator